MNTNLSKALKSNLLIFLLTLVAGSAFAQAKLGVAQVVAPGWVSPGRFGYEYRLYSVAGYLTTDGVFEANPSLGSSLAEDINGFDSFLEVGGYYAGFRWADVADMEAAFPNFTFIQNPALEGIVSYQQVRVIVNPKATSGTSGNSDAFNKQYREYRKTKESLKNAKKRLRKANSWQEIARIRRQIAALERKLAEYRRRYAEYLRSQ